MSFKQNKALKQNILGVNGNGKVGVLTTESFT